MEQQSHGMDAWVNVTNLKSTIHLAENDPTNNNFNI